MSAVNTRQPVIGTMAPALLLVGLVNVVPALYAVYGSLRDIEYYNDTGFVGLDNYLQIFTSNQFVSAVRLSVTFTFVCLAIALPTAFVIALAVRGMGQRGATLMAWLLVPWALGPFAVALIWEWILTPASSGLLNGVLAFFALGPVSLLAEPTSAFVMLVGVAVWRTVAFAALVLVAGMSQIPEDLLAASAIDRATYREQVREIIFPLLRTSVLAAGVVLTISYFNEVQLIIGLTNGGPRGATSTLAYRLYQVGVVQFDQGLANAMSLVMLTINLILVAMFAAVTGRFVRTKSVTA